MVPLNKFSFACENRSAAAIGAVSTQKRRKVPFAGQHAAIYGILVEPRGIEPLTSSLRTTRSPI